MTRPLLALVVQLLLALHGAKVQAETLPVRSGEHGDFTRIVVEAGGAKPWVLGRVGLAYELRIDGKDIEFDVAGVFSRIPRTRLTELASGSLPGSLRLEVAQGAHALATVGKGGRVIVDIRDGPAPEGSPFETALPPKPTAPNPAAVARRTPGQPDTDHLPGPSFSQDPHAVLPLFWRGISTGDTMAKGASLATLPIATPPPSPQPAEGAGDVSDNSARLAFDGEQSSGLSQQARDAYAEMALPSRPQVQESENELLRQLGRAVAQGLVAVEPSSDPAVEPLESAAVVTVPERAAPKDEPTVAALPDNALAVETAMDRDALVGRELERLTSEGDGCIPDAALDIADWGEDGPFDRQLADARASLVGEFDRPSRPEVEKLARLYLFMGMGAEARQVLRAFGSQAADAGILHDVARLVDGLELPVNSRLPDMADCDGNVALWAFLGTSGPDGDVNVNAVLRSFSALPGQLRVLLGERLSDRLLSRGDAVAARAVLNAMRRTGNQANRKVSALQSEMAINGDRPAEAEEALLGIAAANDPLSRRALAAVLLSRLERGTPAEPALIDQAASLAFEHRHDPEGPVFADLEIRSRALAGDIAAALDAYERWKVDEPGLDKAATFDGLFSAVLEKADDALFARIVLSHTGKPEFRSISGELSLAISRRLNDLGFATEAEAVLAAVTESEQAAGVERARAALALFDPEQALLALGRIEGEAANRSRARALSMLGQHDRAHDAYVASGDPTAASGEAWRAGDRERAGAYEPVASALAEIRTSSSRGATFTMTEPSIAAGKALAESSVTLRGAIAALLDGTGTKVNPVAEN